ncbi:MAG: inositol phosphorylceramide synthase [Mycobacteriaceae bacterium]|nr:inositol phosphorylceramide synthase [Mycobacteriaceae bacterium]
MQLAAGYFGCQGPLHSLVSDYLATPKSATVGWVALGVAMVGLPNRWRIGALSSAVVLDVGFAVERLLRGGAFAVGNGPVIVLTALVVLAWRRLVGLQRNNALHAIAYAILLILASKVGDTWLRVTAAVRPTVFDKYAMLADHALGQPSWLVGRAVDAAGPVFSGVLHWVYIELPAAALVVAAYQLRNVSAAGWPQHFLFRTFLLLGLVGPVIYIVFPLVGPEFAFSSAGQGFQVGDYWPHHLPPLDLSPRVIAFDDYTPRNCMPSMHTAWALAVFIHSRGGPRWLRWGGIFWLIGTIAATLGFGYHYGVDLVAGALLCITAEAALRQPVRGAAWSRTQIAAAGSALLALLLVSCRYLAGLMARYPIVSGLLIVGTLVVFTAAFYVTFLGRPQFARESRGAQFARGGQFSRESRDGGPLRIGGSAGQPDRPQPDALYG